MGNTAVLHLKDAFAYWLAEYNRESKRAARVGHRLTLEPMVEKGYEPREGLDMGGQIFAVHVEKAGWVKMPRQCGDKEPNEPIPTHTLNIVSNFPKYDMRTLVAIAKSFGFKGAQDIDEFGKNIYHHVFTAMKYCQLFGEIALRAFEPNSEPLAGNNRDALTRKIPGGYQPRGWTALHILCHGSDYMLSSRKVIEAMLENKVVDISAFDVANDGVRVFWSFLGYQLQRPLGLHSPPLSESDTTLGNPSAPSTNTHIRTYVHTCTDSYVRSRTHTSAQMGTLVGTQPWGRRGSLVHSCVRNCVHL